MGCNGRKTNKHYLRSMLYNTVLGEITVSIQKSTEALLVTSKEIGLGVNAEKTKSVCLSLTNRMQGNNMIYRQERNPLRGQHSSDIWEQL
jgi:hypothetical protein